MTLKEIADEFFDNIFRNYVDGAVLRGRHIFPLDDDAGLLVDERNGSVVLTAQHDEEFIEILDIKGSEPVLLAKAEGALLFYRQEIGFGVVSISKDFGVDLCDGCTCEEKLALLHDYLKGDAGCSETC